MTPKDLNVSSLNIEKAMDKSIESQNEQIFPSQ